MNRSKSMTLLRLVAVSAALTVAPACIAISDGTDKLIDTRELTVPLDDAASIFIDVTRGDLEVTGEERADIRIEAEFWGEVYGEKSARDLLANLELTHEAADGILTLKTRVQEGSLGEDGWINLKIKLPNHLPLEIDDSWGDIVVKGILNDVTIADRSGEVTVTDIGGDLSIDDSTHDITVRHVTGGVTLIDSSGDIRVEDAGADVFIDDSYGEISVTRVGGNLTIDDGSGDILVKNVEGDFEVTRKSRGGDIEHEGVKGKVTLPDRRR